MKHIALTIICLLLLFSSQAQKSKPIVKEKTIVETFKKAVIETSYGQIIIKLYNNTPLHRDNFISLVNSGFYNGLLFHRVIENFMIQGGDPESKGASPEMILGNGGSSNPKIPAEFNPNLIHKKGAIAAARDNNPEKASNPYQFYIVDGKKQTDVDLDAIENKIGIKYTKEQREIYKRIGGTPFLDLNYTVFGEVISGLDIIDKISKVAKNDRDRPITDLAMNIKMDNDVKENKIESDKIGSSVNAIKGKEIDGGFSKVNSANQSKFKLYQVVNNNKDGKMGFINLNGNIIIPCIYDWVQEFNEGFAVFSQNNQMGLIDTKGNVVIEPVYKYLGTMSDGMIVFKEDKKYGFLNSQGKVVISNIYDRANSFSEGLAAVTSNNKTGYINKQGKLIIPQKFASAYTFREGLAKVILEEKKGWLDGGYINKTGKIVIPCNFYTGNDNTSREEDGFYGGVARASIDGETWGYINKIGKFVINPIYSSASDFKEGLASVWKDKNSTMGFINISGKVVIPFDYKGGEAFSDGIAKVIIANDNGYDWTYINKKGEFITEIRHGQYGVATNYKDGLARVFNDNGESYYIDKTGKFFHNYFSEDIIENTTDFKISSEYSYTGRLKNGFPDGQGKWTKSDGSWYDGEFKNGKENGIGTLRQTDGKRYTGNFTDGVPNGQFKVEQWTLMGLSKNSWTAEYKMGQLVGSNQTEDGMDKMFSGNSTTSSNSSNQKSTSSSTIKIVATKNKKEYCGYSVSSYKFFTYLNDNLLSPPKLTESFSVISLDKNGFWWTGCVDEIGSEKIGKFSNFESAVKGYYKLRYEQSNGIGTFVIQYD